MRPARVLFLFLDGVGLGPADPDHNPFAALALPGWSALLGGRRLLAGEAEQQQDALAVRAADATLGMDGTPQSGTGQTALLTGLNAAREFGRHFGPWVPTTLRERLGRESVLQRARAAGRSAAFANAYPLHRVQASDAAGWRRPAAPPLAAHAAGLLTRGPAELRAGQALVSEITTVRWRRHIDPGAPAHGPEQAGRILGRLCADAELTLFAHYDTDHAGHRQQLDAARAALHKVDAFLAGLLPALPADALLVVASDHGNLEDLRTGHTRNPVPVIARGPGAGGFAERVRAITDVAPAILNILGAEHLL